MRAGCWPVASLRVPHGGVDGRAGGVRNVQVGQQRAHVQGIGVPDEDLTEDRGVGGKQYSLPGGGGGEEWEDVRGPRRGGEHDVGRVLPREWRWGSGTTGRRSTVRRQVAQWRRSQTRAMLWRSVWGCVLGSVGTCGARRGGGAVTWEGARRRRDASDVCVVLRVERSSRRSSSRPALSSRGGAPWGEEECHMPSRLNPNCVGGLGRGAAGRCSDRYTAVVAVRSSKGVTRRGKRPAVAARMGGCVNRRHARSNCRA